MAQVRATSNFFIALGRAPGGAAVLEGLSSLPFAERALVGFRSGFSTQEEAERCVERYGYPGHEHPNQTRRQLAMAETARPSDYAVLFHLDHLLPHVKRLIDLGGSAANLFYCYDRYLQLPADFHWTVVDLEPVIAVGMALAKERNETRVHFVTSLEQAGEADVLLVSGALHYFEQPLGELLDAAGVHPRYVLVNRSPVSDKGSLVAIQDGGAFMHPARVLDRGALLASMQNAGYRLDDEWIAAELNLRFPMRPRKSVAHYAGLFFVRMT